MKASVPLRLWDWLRLWWQDLMCFMRNRRETRCCHASGHTLWRVRRTYHEPLMVLVYVMYVS